MIERTTSWTPLRDDVSAEHSPTPSESGTEQRPPPHVAAVLEHLVRCQARTVNGSTYLADMAAALRLSLSDARACVESLRDQGAVVATGAEAGNLCVCLTLRGLRLAAASRSGR